MSLDKKISQYRKSLGVSQEELGGRLGVSRQAVSKWETGAATPDMANLIALAREFGISVAELTETPEPQPEPTPQSEPDPRPKSSDPLYLLTPTEGLDCKERMWFIFLALLFAVLIAGMPWLYRRVTTSQVGHNPQTLITEFALVWDGADGSIGYLRLGPQDAPFPFGAALELTAPEEVLDTDFSGTPLHRADCGAVLIEYRHIEADPELGPQDADQDVIDALSTIVPGYTTPRSIGPGSTEEELLAAYYDELDLTYCLKEEDGYSLVPHDYYYAWTSFSDSYSVILFYIERGLVVGIRMEDLHSSVNLYASDNISRFPMQYGKPDFSHRREPEREDLSDTRRVYNAFNQLETNDSLTAEERYAYRRDIFTLLPDLDWTELGQMGAAEYPEDTIFALMDWLREQDSYSASEILWIQKGCDAQGLDGAYTDSYSGILSHAFFCDPTGFAKCLATNSIPEETSLHAIRFTAYDAEWHPVEFQAALDILDEALDGGAAFTEAEAGWAKLLRLYLTTPIEQRNELPQAPSELP